ncbi:carbonic anhydrase [Neoroseomonas soli]|uniref:carbonic anhydrase n=1 Tax=Neoroseomonas soli TaxID=1081025 RepID=A0A9X9X428_9PROT|nr:carbonic anhydrase [Neoroseomonas soli]MBR0674157.1 carbonic anhydrase [Neoroseomonas soli]
MCLTCQRPSLGRRGLFAVGASLLASAAPAARAEGTGRAATPAAALQALMEGNARYVANQPLGRDFAAGRAARARGQAPFAAILGCADSRVVPELAFDQNPGDLFVVRVAGNFVTPAGLGSLEFGATALGTRLILVLGHTRCGAVNATVAALRHGNNPPGHIADVVRAMKPGIEPALAQSGDDLARRAVVANIRHNVRALETATPILADLVGRGALRIAGGLYDLETGRVGLV